MALRLGVGVVLPDVLNVRDFGAKGDGVTDDTLAIQAAIDSAFGTAASPHGTNTTLNKALYFPNGSYLVSSPLVLTQVRGAHIFGSGQLTTTINNLTDAVLVTNGLEYCNIENMSLGGRGAGGIAAAAELDWDGTGSVGLAGNIFTNCGFSSIAPSAGAKAYACRIGFSGFGGTGFQFYTCYFQQAATAGLVTWSAGVTALTIQGGGASQNPGVAYWFKAGQCFNLHDIGFSGNGKVFPAAANSSVTWATGTATVNTSSPHGITIGNSFSLIMSGVTPNGYNGTQTGLSTGASQFTYPLSTNPSGTPASAPGNYTIFSGGDILMDSAGPLLVGGTRTESLIFCVCSSSSSVAVLDGCSSSTQNEFCHTKGRVILDSCTMNAATIFCTDPAYIGTAYARGCGIANAAFFTQFSANGGTVPQNI